MNFGIIVLNYLAFESTINCVNDFINQKTYNDNIKICIVDNYSGNDSYVRLKDYYKKNNEVDVVKTNKNLGFANGNNFGICFLKKKYGDMFNYYIVSNDDILLPNPGLFKWIHENYVLYNFSVLGPKVYSVNGKFYQSPLPNHSQSIYKCVIRIIKQYIKLYYFYFRDLFGFNAQMKEVFWASNEQDCLSFDKTLHGSFLVFSNNYFAHYDLPFDDETYLYMEEDILRLRCDLAKIVMEYNPDYEIHHLQAISTNMMLSDYNRKMIFRIKNIIRSLKRYIYLLKQSKNR